MEILGNVSVSEQERQEINAVFEQANINARRLIVELDSLAIQAGENAVKKLQQQPDPLFQPITAFFSSCLRAFSQNAK